MTEIRHRTVETNGIHMHVAEQGAGLLVVLCHGFPESWYSWRHQLSALAAAGFRAVAPDLRGYGQTDQPPEIDQYTLLHSIGDMVGLLDALGAEQAVIVGHDWGAPLAWGAAVLRPDRFRGVIALSVRLSPSRSGSAPARRRLSTARHDWRRAGSRAPASPARRRARRPISIASAAPPTAGSRPPSSCGVTFTLATRRPRHGQCCSRR